MQIEPELVAVKDEGCMFGFRSGCGLSKHGVSNKNDYHDRQQVSSHG
jgi:hypothetical protein